MEKVSWVSPNVAARLVKKPARTIRYQATAGLIAAKQDVNGYWSVLVVEEVRDNTSTHTLASWRAWKNLANLASDPSWNV